MLMLVVTSVERMKSMNHGKFKHLNAVDIHNPVNDQFLNSYDDWVHENEFGPRKVSMVTELVGDGHEKVLSRMCAEEPLPRGQEGPRRMESKNS